MKIDNAKVEQAKKEYVAKRRSECFDIYNKEKKNWHNVMGVEYSEIRDICIVKYRGEEPAKPKEHCEKIMAKISNTKSEVMADLLMDAYNNCENNTFSRDF